MTGRHAAMPEPVDEDLGSPPSGAHRADTDAVPVVDATGETVPVTDGAQPPAAPANRRRKKT